jgi:hypothetical protein
MSIALDDTHVYWTNNDGTVMKVSKDGGSLTLVAVGPPEAWSIALGNTHVYWASGANSPGGMVMKVSKEGGSPVVLALDLARRNLSFSGSK